MTTTTPIEPGIARATRESRLHLYAARGCPFCHRVLLALALTDLEGRVGVTWMRNVKGEAGWEIVPGDDPLFGETTLKGVYERLEPGVDQRPSVPLLVDASSNTLLSSSSAAMTRFVARGLNGACPVDRDLAPAGLVERIDRMNEWLHDNVNRQVYKVGFSNTQSEYEERVAGLFRSLDELEARLSARPYVLGGALTESDLYLLATLVRFDSVYHPLFKCSYRRIAEYPALSAYLERLQAMDGVAATYDHRLTKEHYFRSVMHVAGEVRDLNPSRLVPVDPLPGNGTEAFFPDSSVPFPASAAIR